MPATPNQAPPVEKRSLAPRIIIATVVVAAVVAGFVAHGHSSAPPATVPLSVTTTTAPGTTTTVTPAKPSIILPSQSAFPAYQHMPYTANGITVAVTGTASKGRLTIEVFSDTLTLAQEHAAYTAFLRLYHDPGTEYLPAFTPAPPPGD